MKIVGANKDVETSKLPLNKTRELLSKTLSEDYTEKEIVGSIGQYSTNHLTLRNTPVDDAIHGRTVRAAPFDAIYGCW